MIFGFLANGLIGQTDSTAVDSVYLPLMDSLKLNDSLPVNDSSLLDPDFLTQEDSLLEGTGDSTTLVVRDTLAQVEVGSDSLSGRLKEMRPPAKKKFEIGDYKPEFIKTKEKARLRLKFPWRESVDVPIPKGFLPSPWTEVPDPDVSWQRALMFPGLGQVYNRSSWKVPIFYLGYGAVGGWMAYTQSQYSLYQTAFFCFENGCTIPSQAVGDGEGLRTQRESWRQRRDQAILIIIAWHGISAVEAYVDAHLKDFDVSDDLSFKMGPTMISGPAPALGMGLSFRFENKKNTLEYVKNSSPWIWKNGQGR